MNKWIIILLLHLVPALSIAQEYRIKKIKTVYHYETSEDRKTEMEFTYDAQNRMSSVNEIDGGKQTVYRFAEDKRKISMTAGKNNDLFRVEYDKKGNMTDWFEDELKYSKENQLKEIKFKDYDSGKANYKLFYDDENKLAVAAQSKDNADVNYLLYYNESGKCTKAELGLGKGFRPEIIKAEWNGNQLKSLSGYENQNGIIKLHEFINDEKGLVIEEKIYVETEKNPMFLIRHHTIEYEPGTSNEEKIFFQFRNWKVNLLFNGKTVDRYIKFYA